ncbi:MAG TPA: hypothetical protein VIC29_10620 [Steroidobacteraceae bacterium]
MRSNPPTTGRFSALTAGHLVVKAEREIEPGRLHIDKAMLREGGKTSRARCANREFR